MSDPLKLWRLSEALTVFQTAMLICGHDPENYHSGAMANWQTIPQGYGAAKTALVVGIRSGSIRAKIVREDAFDEYEGHQGEIPGTINLDETYIEVESVIEFLKRRNLDTSVFGAVSNNRPDYMNPDGPFYAAKLAAAVDAWVQVTKSSDETAVGTPKRRLDTWLRKNASKYELTKADGNANEEAIQQISKIANWRPEGGASKTPAHRSQSPNADENPSTPLQRVVKKNDDDIPF